ncbi:MAG: ACP S-malonyltransferase [Actinobacteria bacterium]|nr:ACP S-malonyltransferase [Actinomycetota bacterium]
MINKVESGRKYPKIALIFPGQGSQFEKMGQQFLRFNSKYLDYFEKAAEVLKKDLLGVINGEDKDNSLNDTRFSQVAIFCLSSALFDYLIGELSLGKKYIDTILGHSLGEYSALYGCGAYTFEKGLDLVIYRGEIMSEADKTAKGMMAAVLGAESELIEDVLEGYKNKVFIANYNDYTQIVISGSEDEVIKAISDLKKKGIKKVIPLKVNIASHCPLMSTVSESLGDFIEASIKFNDPEIPFLSTTEVSYRDGKDIKDTLKGQLVNPIKWVDSIGFLLDRGVDTFIEIGPGKVLSGLTARIARKHKKDITVLNTSDLGDIENTISKLQERGLLDEA